MNEVIMRIRRLVVVLGSIVGLILSAGPALAGQGEGTTTANGWYKGEEIYSSSTVWRKG